LINLNREQQLAADFKNGTAVLNAVCGSGKTFTTTKRIKSLIRKHGVAPENILGLTFTRNAAKSMRDKLQVEIDDLINRVQITTIHSFCFWLQKAEGRVFEILSGYDQVGFIKKIMKKLKINELSPGMILGEISLSKNNIITADEFTELYESDPTMEKVSKIFKSYEEEKTKKLLMDFDDLVLQTYQLLRDNDKIRRRYSETFTHILVDEWQDTSPVQCEIIKLLVDGNSKEVSSFFVVGDDWQSVYSFTGATVSNIINFKNMFPGSKEFILNLNYRSTPQILKACQNLIKHNIRKVEKTLVTENADGEDVVVLEGSTERGEAEIIVTEIIDLIENRSFNYKDIAILYRSNFQSMPLEEALVKRKIPYRIEKGIPYTMRKEIKTMLDYLRLILDPDSEVGDEALRSIINIPNRYISKKIFSDFSKCAESKGLYIYTALKSIPILLPYIRSNVMKMFELLDPLIADAESMGPAEMISLLRGVLDYDRIITEDDIPSPDNAMIQNINELQLLSARFSDIQTFLDYIETFQERSANNDEGVVLSTIHKAKGLEWPVVFVTGFLEGLMPSKKGENIEEERRVAFVGISRARHLLYLSYSHNYLGSPCKKSIFLEEILDSGKGNNFV
jgi:DNA helicase-2/ATP-dependent DNA helicase PcrA